MVIAIACSALMPVMMRATIKEARLGDAADMVMPTRVKAAPVRIPYLRDIRFETCPLAKEEMAAESKMQAT